MRVGKCKKCKTEFKADDDMVDVFNYPFQAWFKLCHSCYDLEVEKGSIKLCNIDVDGVIKEG